MKPGRKTSQIARLLVEEGIVQESQIQAAFKAQQETGASLLDNLIEAKAISSENLYTFLSTHSGAPSIDVRNYEIPRELVDLIPRDFAREHAVLPIDKMGKLLTVGMANPLDTDVITELENLTGLKVKPMLCKGDDLRAKIHRYYPREKHPEYDELLPQLEIKIPPSRTGGVPVSAGAPPSASALETAPPPAPSPAKQIAARNTLAETLEQIEALPPLPETVARMRRVGTDSGKAVRELAGVASMDPVVAATLLRVANTFPYGMPGRVGNINVAILLLGVQGAQEALRVFEETTWNKTADFDYAQFWKRSLFCASAAMAMVKEKGSELVPEAYTAGLLHELGQLVMAYALPPESREAVEAGEYSHTEIGYMLAVEWRFPETIALPIRFHHEPHHGAEGELVAEVAMGAVMAEVFERGAAMHAADFEEYTGLLQEIGIDASRALRIFSRVSKTFRGQKGPE